MVPTSNPQQTLAPAHAGGAHWSTAALAALMQHAGACVGQSGAPPSQALLFGIGGGYGAGYSFCPSTTGRASGVMIPGRHKLYSMEGAFTLGALRRLGLEPEVRETTSDAAALKHLRDCLAAGRPALLWVDKNQLSYQALAERKHSAIYMHVVLVRALDEERGRAWVGDEGPGCFEVELDELARARSGVCSYKRRLASLAPTRPLSRARLKEAIGAGLEACVSELTQPRMKGWSPLGFEQWAKLLDNEKNQRGWPVLYPDASLYKALRDVFLCVEVWPGGGGLYRTLYAQFLEEAAELCARKRLAKVAPRFAELGERWSAFAESLLPDSWAPLKTAKRLMRKRGALLRDKGPAGAAAAAKAARELDEHEERLMAESPFSYAEALDHLRALRAKLEDLIALEQTALTELARVI